MYEYALSTYCRFSTVRSYHHHQRSSVSSRPDPDPSDQSVTSTRSPHSSLKASMLRSADAAIVT